MKSIEKFWNVIIYDIVHRKLVQQTLLILRYKSIYLEKIVLLVC